MTLSHLRKQSKAGFTLIELLVVIAIIGILGAFLVPVVGNALKNGRKVKSITSARQVATGLYTWALDNKRVYPDSSGAEYGGKQGSSPSGSLGGGMEAESRPLYTYIEEPEAFKAAGDEGDGVISDTSVFDAVGTSYIMATSGGSAESSGIETIRDTSVSSIISPSTKVAVNEPTLFNNRDPRTTPESKWYSQEHAGVVGFIDGHAAYILNEDYSQLPEDEEEILTRQYY